MIKYFVALFILFGCVYFMVSAKDPIVTQTHSNQEKVETVVHFATYLERNEKEKLSKHISKPHSDDLNMQFSEEVSPEMTEEEVWAAVNGHDFSLNNGKVPGEEVLE